MQSSREDERTVPEEREELQVVAASAAGPKKGSTFARLAGSSVAGLLEIALWHPADVVAKRLMVNEGQIHGANMAATMSNVNSVIFREYANEGFFTKWGSLYPGLGWGAAYKVLQRVYKFGGQPFVKDYLNTHAGDTFTSTFGKTTGKTMMSATAGSIIGIGEVVLLPLDRLKILAQVNPEVLAGRSPFSVFWEEGWGLYKGAGWTVVRNAPGSFALFGGNSVAKDLMGVKNHNDATVFQDFVASVSGAAASITVASPMDVLKTRVQALAFEENKSSLRIIGDLMANEGPQAFFKGLTPKLLVAGPKLCFAMTVASQAIASIQKMVDGN